MVAEETESTSWVGMDCLNFETVISFHSLFDLKQWCYLAHRPDSSAETEAEEIICDCVIQVP